MSYNSPVFSRMQFKWLSRKGKAEPKRMSPMGGDLHTMAERVGWYLGYWRGGSHFSLDAQYLWKDVKDTVSPSFFSGVTNRSRWELPHPAPEPLFWTQCAAPWFCPLQEGAQKLLTQLYESIKWETIFVAVSVGFKEFDAEAASTW